MKNKINSLFDYRNCATLTFINFWFAIFVDSIFAYKNFKITHPETIVYLIVTNVSFVVFLIATIKKSKAYGVIGTLLLSGVLLTGYWSWWCLR